MSLDTTDDEVSRRRYRRTGASWLLLVVVLVIGTVAAIVSWTQAERSADDRQDVALERVREQARGAAENRVAGLAGANALLDDRGAVDDEDLRGFARDLRAASELDAVAHAAVVGQAQRSSFEAELGRPIVEFDADGATVAGPREEYWVLRSVVPRDDVTGMLVGVDIAANEISSGPARAARDEGTTQLTEPVTLPAGLVEDLVGSADEVTLMFILRPLYEGGAPATVAERREALRGFVVSAVTTDQLATDLRTVVDEQVDVRITDGDTALVGPSEPLEGPSREVDILGRTWQVQVDDTRPADQDLTLLVVSLTLLLAVLVAVITWRERRHLSRLRQIDRRARARAEALSRLAEELATADTVERACDIVLRAAPPPVGATAVSIGLIDDQADELLIRHGATVAEDLSRRYAHPALSEPLAFTDAARTGSAVLIESFEEYRRRYPGTHQANALLGEGARAAMPLLIDGRSIGAIAIAWDEDRRFDDELLFSLSTIAELAAQAVHRARLTELHTHDAARSRGLAAFAQALSACHHPDEVAAATVEHLGPLTEACAVVLLHRDGLEWSSAHAPSDGIDPRLLDLLVGSGDTEDAGVLAEVAQGEGRRVVHVDDVGSATVGQLLEQAGFASTAQIALSGEDRRPIGALWLGWSERLVPAGDPEDLLSTVADMIEQSLVRTLGSDQLRSDSERNQLLAEFARRLANVRRVDQLCRVVIDDGGSAVGAAVANLGLVDDSLGLLVVEPNPFFTAEDHESFAERHLDDPLPGTDAVRSGEPVLLSDANEVANRYPGRIAQTMAAHGLRSSAHLPLLAADGRAIGCVGFAWPHRQEFRPVKLARLRTIAELCAQTLERARLAEAEHRLVGSIHRRIVGRTTAVAGTKLATRYLPAAQEIGMGGDWYDTVALDAHRIAVIVGDVAGHGIGAVADMVELRSLIRATLLQDVAPADALHRVSVAWRDETDSLATACVSLVDTRTGTLEHLSAGHIPGFVRRPDGSVSLLDRGRIPLLGVPGRPVEPHRVEFPPGSTLFVCTDGLIERRDRSIDESIDAMSVVIAGLDTAAGVEAMADAVIEGCRPGPAHEDDIALVVVEATNAVASIAAEPSGPAQEAGELLLDHTFESGPAAVPEARSMVAELLGSAATMDMSLAISELVTNAVLHGRGDVRLQIRSGPGVVRAAVHDQDRSPPVVVHGAPDAVGGRGLRIIEAIAERWGVTEVSDGKWVWVELAVDPTTTGAMSG